MRKSKGTRCRDRRQAANGGQRTAINEYGCYRLITHFSTLVSNPLSLTPLSYTQALFPDSYAVSYCLPYIISNAFTHNHSYTHAHPTRAELSPYLYHYYGEQRIWHGDRCS